MLLLLRHRDSNGINRNSTLELGVDRPAVLAKLFSSFCVPFQAIRLFLRLFQRQTAMSFENLDACIQATVQRPKPPGRNTISSWTIDFSYKPHAEML